MPNGGLAARQMQSWAEDRILDCPESRLRASCSLGRRTTRSVHILSSDDPATEFHAPWHNSEVLDLQNESRAYLFARFTWAVIQSLKPFVLARVTRNVVRVAVDRKGYLMWKARLELGKGIDEQYGNTSAADSEAESSTQTLRDSIEPNIHLKRLKLRLEIMKR